MQKLLAKFKASRSLADARRLITYNRKHPFTDVFLTADEQVLLIEANNMVREDARPSRDLAPTREQWVSLLAEVSR